jgi:D-3-phosphoglycerate dehydrogenase
MPHVLVAGRIHEAGIDVLRSAPGITFDLVDEVSTASYAPKIPEADALLIRTQPLPASVIETAPRLRVVSRHGVGYDSVDAAALTARGIPLAVVGDVNSRAVAEHTLTLMLALAKRVTVHDRATRDGNWSLRNTFSAREVGGRRLLLIGYGRIGRMVGDMARAFGMHVTVYDPFQAIDAIRATGAEPVASLPEGLATADVVSLHIPKSGSKAVIGAEELALMRSDALLINTGRGGLVDEDALATALDEGRLGGAGLDVFVQEPPTGHERLLRSDRAILSPHIAGLTEECTIRMGEVAARNIVDFFEGKLDEKLVVNLPGP